jgi:hypothetical protein
MPGIWRTVAAAACVVILLTSSPAGAMLVRFTAPTMGNAGTDCRDPVLAPLQPSTPLVCVAELSQLGVVIWRDSTTASPGAAIAFVRPTPAVGTYTLKAWARFQNSPARCDTSFTFAVLAPNPPVAPKGLRVE